MTSDTGVEETDEDVLLKDTVEVFTVISPES